jgi:hypothetical protein
MIYSPMFITIKGEFLTMWLMTPHSSAVDFLLPQVSQGVANSDGVAAPGYRAIRNWPSNSDSLW